MSFRAVPTVILLTGRLPVTYSDMVGCGMPDFRASWVCVVCRFSIMLFRLMACSFVAVGFDSIILF